MGMVDYVNKAPSRRMLLAGVTPKWIANSKYGSYIAAVLLSAPPWVDNAELRKFKKRAAELTHQTGVLHVVDHIVPLRHPRVCGLTVPWNLRVIPWRGNSAKSNHWVHGQPDLFDLERTEHRPAQPDLFSDYNKENCL